MNLKFEFHNHGFEVHTQACAPELLARLQREVSLEEAAEALKPLAARVLGEGCFVVRADVEDQSAQAEPWHQDVWAHVDRGGHDRLLSVRLSLDDCSFFDGALKLCPSSYKHGILTPNEVRGHSLRPFSSPEMKAGDVMLVHPLTIHASAASTTGKPRRVVHVVFAAAELAGLLRP